MDNAKHYMIETLRQNLAGYVTMIGKLEELQATKMNVLPATVEGHSTHPSKPICCWVSPLHWKKP